jgi:uroporphyrinogen-III synthase
MAPLTIKGREILADYDGQNMTDELPLTGLKIVVTRPRDQAVELARSIEQAGGVALLFPLLDITAVQDTRELQEQISRLAQFDLAIFISPNAVHYGIEAIRSAGKLPCPPQNAGGKSSSSGGADGRQLPQSAGFASNVSLPPTLKIATVGQGSAKALRELGITNVITPSERFDSEGLLALPELQNVAGRRVMIFRGDGGRELLGDTLKARGATVEYAACYRRSKPQQDAGALLAEAPDAISVTSSEALGYLWQMLDDKTRKVIRQTPIFVPHSRIADLAIQQGWQQVKLTGSGDDGLLTALSQWAEDRRQRTKGKQSSVRL